MSNVTRIMIVDDHPLMRKGIQQLLTIEPSFLVVAEAASRTFWAELLPIP